MGAKGTVIAFSGAIGTGKSKISTALGQRLHWPRTGFGDYVRSYARANGKDPDDRATLQALGQALVLTDVDGFVAKVLSQVEWMESGNLILDGLRHVEVRQALLQQLRDVAVLKLVHVTVDEDTRLERAGERGIEQRMLSRYDQDLTEAQMSRIVPPYADLILDGTLPVEMSITMIVSKLGLRAYEPA